MDHTYHLLQMAYTKENGYQWVTLWERPVIQDIPLALIFILALVGQRKRVYGGSAEVQYIHGDTLMRGKKAYIYLLRLK
jgi:hypothetical protein